MAGTWLMGDAAATVGRRPTAVLVAVHPEQSDGSGPGSDTSLAELRRLADTDGLAVADAVVQNRAKPDPATFVGAGKADELAEVAARNRADVVIADGELSPGQVRNLEERTGVRVVDRTALILDIFAEHARTSEGRLQVELAQIAYQLPRLRGDGRSMSRVGGGRMAGGAGMGVRGPGEMKLETQRRRLRQRATRLRGNVAELSRRRERRRGRRARNRVPSVAITGYTNAGKSALLNRLTGADAQVQDVLFATLDPTVRRISTGDLTYTVTDTVGFVRHLPHQLVDAFRSTLEEVTGADLVLHVVDASAPDALEQITTVHGVLHEIGAGDLPELLVLNKIDIAPPDWVDALCRACPEAVPVSAVTGEGVHRLRVELAARLSR
ncbi:GTPase HflX [Micromonospora sp. C28ISP2-4]|uniref:GTPase HflX n=1 Tax=Micromonospora sp. C28ISP2-4 TaxID=3059523 RepID=UPI0026774FBD|nr:GTPase HflX [Micromonospora sp. C28ISP2-4]MDO3686800.1 GTPase HflX [Micromonospora sp. C28ISP2-4]